MGGSCKGGCLEDAKARLVLLQVFLIAMYFVFCFFLEVGGFGGGGGWWGRGGGGGA